MNLEEITNELNRLKVERAMTDEQFKQAEKDLKADRSSALKELDERIEALKSEAETLLDAVGAKSVKTASGTIKKVEYDQSKASNWKPVKKWSIQEKRDIIGHIESVDADYVKEETTKKLDDSRIKKDMASGLLVNQGGSLINTETGEVLCEALFEPKEPSIIVEEV